MVLSISDYCNVLTSGLAETAFQRHEDMILESMQGIIGMLLRTRSFMAITIVTIRHFRSYYDN